MGVSPRLVTYDMQENLNKNKEYTQLQLMQQIQRSKKE